MTITEDAVFCEGRSLGRCTGTSPGPDGVPCDYLKPLGPKCIAALAEEFGEWTRDTGTSGMAEVWLTSRLSFVPQSFLHRSVVKLRPLGLFPSLQKVAARTLLEAALEDWLP